MKAKIKVRYSRMSNRYVWTVRLGSRRFFNKYTAFGYAGSEEWARETAIRKARHLYNEYKKAHRGPVVETIEL